MTTIDALNEEIGILRADAATMEAEIARLSDALAKANADRDRLAQQLGMAQTEARGLRIELQRLSAPNGGVA
jgi:predicted  nucleic acid-binding Zn-ribbon protein